MTTSFTRRRYFVVDVFTDAPLMGNPVAVVVDAEGLDTQTMQRIARWTNLSETTFCFTPTATDADYRLRIFTPRAELPFAGHPTLGSVHALRAVGKLAGRQRVVQQCQAGLIPIQQDGERYFFRLPEPRQRVLSAEHCGRLERALGVALEGPIPQLIDVGPRWIIARMRSREQLREMTPDLGLLERLEVELDATGVTLFASDFASSANDIEVRSFAPSQGVPEDPVCGSGNGAVAVFRRDVEWSQSLVGYRASQGHSVGRDGHIEVRYDGSTEIWIGGQSVITTDGFLNCD